MNKKIIFIISILFITCSLANAGNSPIFSAAHQGDTKEIRKLLEEGINVDFKNDLGATALMLAADNGKLEAVKLLVKHKADINARNNDGDTPLIRAANNGHFDVVRFLVEKGADTNAHHGNNKKNTAYEYAKKNGHYQIANYLEPITTVKSQSAASNSSSSCYIKGQYVTKGMFKNEMVYSGDCSNGRYSGKIISCTHLSSGWWQCSGEDSRMNGDGQSKEEAVSQACGCN